MLFQFINIACSCLDIPVPHILGLGRQLLYLTNQNHHYGSNIMDPHFEFSAISGSLVANCNHEYKIDKDDENEHFLPKGLRIFTKRQ